MARAPTGTVSWREGRWRVRVTLVDGSRPWFDLPVPLTQRQVATARKYALEMAEEVRAGNYRPKQVTASGGESVADWFKRWFASRRVRGLSSISTDQARINQHVLPVLGEVPIVSIRKADIERVVANLDATVRAGKLSWKTAHNAWGLLSRAFKDACRSKDLTLRCREDNPCTDVAPPDRGANKSKCYLFPSELLMLVSCEALPLANRRRYALAVYLSLRAGELAALAWDAIDLEHGTASIHEAIVRESGARGATKTGETRRFAVEPEILPLLRAMHEEAGGKGLVCSFVHRGGGHMARDLRLDLAAAGVTRPELFMKSSTRVPLSFHDLRATGITWMAVRGDPPLQIRHRAGHSEFQTTELYIREAEAVRQGFGTVFPALPPSLLVPCEGVESSRAIVPGAGMKTQVSESKGKLWWRRRESNPAKTSEFVEKGGVSVSEIVTDDDADLRTATPQSSPPGRLPTNPREAFVRALGDAVQAATATGDLGAARIALEALGKLLADAGPTIVVDPTAERQTRER